MIVLSAISRALVTFKSSLEWQIKIQDLTVSVILSTMAVCHSFLVENSIRKKVQKSKWETVGKNQTNLLQFTTKACHS